MSHFEDDHEKMLADTRAAIESSKAMIAQSEQNIADLRKTITELEEVLRKSVQLNSETTFVPRSRE